MSDELTLYQQWALEFLGDLGTTATLEKVTSTYSYDNAGTVSETVVSHTVTSSDLLDIARDYGTLQTDQRVAGIMYIAASGLTVEPALGDRIVYQSRNFAIMLVQPYRICAGVAAYRLELAEIGS